MRFLISFIYLFLACTNAFSLNWFFSSKTSHNISYNGEVINSENLLSLSLKPLLIEIDHEIFVFQKLVTEPSTDSVKDKVHVLKLRGENSTLEDLYFYHPNISS